MRSQLGPGAVRFGAGLNRSPGRAQLGDETSGIRPRGGFGRVPYSIPGRCGRAVGLVNYNTHPPAQFKYRY